MAARIALSFDHLVPPAGSNGNQANITAKMLGDMPLVYKPIGGAKGMMVRPDGYITNVYTGLSTGSAIGLTTSKIKVGSPKKSWFGCRLKSTFSPVLSIPALVLATPSFVLNGTTQGAMACLQGDLASTTVGMLNKEFYVELGIDWVNHTIERRVDGEFHSVIGVPPAVATSMDANTADVLLIGTYGSNNQCSFRDIYWIDNTDDGSLNGPLGPQFTALLEEEVVEPTIWTPSVGLVKDVLSTKVDMTANVDTPTLSSETGLDPLKVRLKLPAGTPAHSIQAVCGFVSAGLAAAGVATLSSTLKQNGVETPPVSSSINATMVHCKPGVTRDKAPDGTNWTVDKVNSTVLSISAT